MEVKLTLHSSDLSRDDIAALLQAIRSCEQRFKEKGIRIVLTASPPLSTAETRAILDQVRPPLEQRCEIPARDNRGRVVSLGSRLVAAGSRVLGTCDELTLAIAEATDQEIEELEAARVIRLIRAGQS